jgi:hypothetical protein
MAPLSRSLPALGLSAAILGVAVVLAQKPEPQPRVEDIPLFKQPTYFKGNLHTHTLWSDGDDYPEMVADWYKQHGYAFLSITDHNVLSDAERWVDETDKTNKGLRKYQERFGLEWVERRDLGLKRQVRLKPLREFRSLLEEPGKFLLIPGEEISSSYAKFPVHVNGINVHDVVPAAKGNNVAETVDVNMRGVEAQRKKASVRMIAILNHPNFGWGVRAEDMVLAEGLKFFEVFNGHPSVRNYGDETHAGTERVWDIVLALRLGKYHLPLTYGVATDDAHGYHEFGLGKVNPGRGWVMVRTLHLTAESIVRAMEAGDFYATSGVTLDEVKRDAKTLRVQIHGEPGVTYKTQFIATTKDASLDSEAKVDKDGNELTVTRLYGDQVGKVVAEVEGEVASYTFTGKELYVRAKVISSKPHPNPYAKGDVETAWVQPVVP